MDYERGPERQYPDQDPLGLRRLPLESPPNDAWPAIAAALGATAGQSSTADKSASRPGQRHHGQGLRWLALAACLCLAVGLYLQRTPGTPGEGSTADTLAGPTDAPSLPAPETGLAGASLEELLALSQGLEQRLRERRADAPALPARSQVYLSELEDLIARVDSELSFNPDSEDLWGQRVNLLLDIAFIYQQHWEYEYGSMASL